jgi:hypothetical protein
VVLARSSIMVPGTALASSAFRAAVSAGLTRVRATPCQRWHSALTAVTEATGVAATGAESPLSPEPLLAETTKWTVTPFVRPPTVKLVAVMPACTTPKGPPALALLFTV